ncbi:MAG: PocR ligand-binding domain-containing protein, partial [Thermodesulfovibrionales bacterium]|nr:PocR ligand-binding domain-containing protein [Thermodesulfovibrionales bacterium]
MENSYKLTDIVDFQSLIDVFTDFYEFTNVPITLIDADFNIVFSVGSLEICSKYHFAHEKTRPFCLNARKEILSLTNSCITTY